MGVWVCRFEYGVLVWVRVSRMWMWVRVSRGVGVGECGCG